MDHSNKGQLVSISTTTPTDIIDAKLEEHQLCASRQCPCCGHKLSKRDWGGLPAGVKFDPTDQELIEHLEAKVGGGGGERGEEGVHEESNKAGHPLIDKFIPTLDGEDGICYTHPEKLPGVTRDGLSRHFFHRPSKAYTTGTRKRRKIQTESDTIQGAAGETRWHKTGKTRPVMVNGRQKGCKKILVLYTNFGKNRKPEKTNWVMHQYHLGQHEEEREGELVVSKIFYQTQPRQCNWSSSVAEKAAASVGPGEGSGEASGSVSSKEVAAAATDELVVVGGGGSMAAAEAYAHAFEIHQQLKADPFGFVSFNKGFDEAGIGGGRQIEGGVLADLMPSMSAAMCDQGQQHEAPSHHHMIQQDQQYPHHHQQQQQHMVNAAFHISRPTHPISQIISPPPMHHASIILDDHGSFHVPRIILPNDNFQQQQQTQQQHHKIGGRAASGLEEIIMGCTSSSSADLKEESSITNQQEAEWLKYSSTFWSDTDNQDHHG